MGLCSCIERPLYQLDAHTCYGLSPLVCPCGETVVSHQIAEQECVNYASCTSSKIKDLAKRRLLNTDNLGLRLMNSKLGSKIVYLFCFSCQKGNWDKSKETWLDTGFSSKFVEKGISLIRNKEEVERQKTSDMMSEFFAFLHPWIVVPSTHVRVYTR